MSNVKLRTPSNGSVTLSPQDTASDVVLTVPAGTSTMVTNATLPTQLNASGSAPIYACRAWVNFNGTTATPSTIRGSGNVSSVTKVGTGEYTVNFTTAMPDVNYSALVTRSRTNPNASASVNDVTVSTGSVRVVSIIATTGGVEDATHMFVSVFR